MGELVVERSIWINAPREKAWRAVTEPAHLDVWYANCCRWEIPALEVGGKVKFFHKDAANTDILNATIVVLDPPREFTLRWEPDQTYPEVTLVTSFRLAVEQNGTRVTIHESGYEKMPEDVRLQWMDATGLGYAGSVENLKALLEGTPLPHV